MLGQPNHHQHMFDDELDDGPSKADAIKSLLFNPVMLLRMIYKKMSKPAGRLLVSGVSVNVYAHLVDWRLGNEQRRAG